MPETQQLIDAVLQGDETKVKLLVMEAISRGDRPGDIMGKGLIAAMDIVGEKMEAEEMFIPEVLMSAKAMGAGVEILKPHLTIEESANSGTVVIGSVQGDLHDIGKNLVKMLMQGAGFTVIDLGTDVKTADFLDAVIANNANVVGMSALLTTTMPVMKDVVTALEENNLRDKVKVIIGGAPVSEAFAKEIGADGYGADAGSAVRIAKALL